MAEQSEVPLSFSGGEDHVAHESRIPEGFARRVVNFDLDDSGVGHQTRALQLQHAAPGAHSLWVDPDTGAVTFGSHGRLRRLEDGAVRVLHWADTGAPIRLPSEARIYYRKSNGDLYFSNGEVHGTVKPDGTAWTWGVPNVASQMRDVDAARVRYLTYQDALGRESGAVRFDTGAPPYVPGLVPRLYWADDESTQYRLDGTGRVLATQGRVQFPPGRFIEELAGRAVTVRGSKVYYSEPFNWGLIDPRYNFASAGGRVTAIAAVSDGMYMATASEIVFLRGLDPEQWQAERMAARGVLPGGMCRIPLTMAPDDVMRAARGGERYVVVMLTEDGPVFAMSSGVLIAPTRGRTRLPRGVEVQMDVVQRNGYYQIVAIPRETGAASTEAADLPTS